MKLTKWIVLVFLLFTVLGCAAQQQQHINNVDQGAQTEASRRGSFSGSHGSLGGTTRSPISSGVRRPSSNVTNPSPYYGTPNAGTPTGTGGFWSRAGAFGAGALAGSVFGSILHPFGGGYYGGMYGGYGGGFSLFGILFWIVIIGFIFSLLRRGRNRW